jgi:hypothetical protein
MAHFTGLKELQNKPHKSGHDISAKNCFTAKVGEILPVWFDFAIPNSTYRFNLEYFTRTRPVQTSDLYSNVNSADKILGYNPRYYNWKTKIDRIHGAFTTTLKDWVAPIDDSFLYSLFGGNLSTYRGITWPFFKVNPNTLDDIFAVKVDSTWETDQLLVSTD